MVQGRTILVVDDDSDLRATLTEQLAWHAEFTSQTAASAAEALDRVRQGRCDLVILNITLPDMDGTDLLKAMRAGGLTCPVIMLTGSVSDADVVSALDAGANDCVSKPFRFAVLLARIRAHLRQHEGSDDAQLQFGGFTFRPSSKHLVSEAGAKLRLTEKEVAILRFLYRAGSQVVARDVLLKEVWGYNPAVTTHTLETHIYRLRQKIEADPANAQLLVTEAGGYRLIA